MKNLAKWALIILFFSPLASFGYAPDPVPCLLELETHFFRSEIVIQALSFYNIPQGMWDPILSDLQDRSASVPNRMRKITAKMVPNPLEYPLQKEAAARVLKEALYSVYKEVMIENLMTEQPTMDLIFEYIFTRRIAALEACLGKQVEKLELQNQRVKNRSPQRNPAY